MIFRFDVAKLLHKAWFAILYPKAIYQLGGTFVEYRQPIPTTMTERNLLLSFCGCIENSDDGFLIVDPEGNIAYINQAYCDYININRDAVLGKPVLEYIDTSQLVEAASDPLFKPQVGVLHKVSAKQYRDGEHYCIVNRANISDGGKPIAGVGQVKFVRSTLKLSSAISDVYNELSYYKEELLRLSAERYSFQSILGVSPEMQQVKALALRTASNDFSVLITGETGTGKEVFANAIHYASKRRDKPFIRINCAAIPSELLESELFGYEEGSFTGARRGGKKGKFELANGGTLFLDEIGDMPLVMQAKILRVLQERELERVGGSASIPIDVRILAATNKDLEQEVAENRFRPDLYFRLNVISISLPPLRKRPEDIDCYIDGFLGELNEKYHTDVTITPKARAQFRQYSWPGNIRELKNIIERCYATQEDGVILSMTIPNRRRPSLDVEWNLNEAQSLEMVMDTVERRVIISAIQRNGGNLQKTAAELGIHRVTLYKKMERHGITRDSAAKSLSRN